MGMYCSVIGELIVIHWADDVIGWNKVDEQFVNINFMAPF